MPRRQTASESRPFVGENVAAVPPHLASQANETLRRHGVQNAYINPKTGGLVAHSEKSLRKACDLMGLRNSEEYR